MNRRAFFACVAAATASQVVGKAVPATVESYRCVAVSRHLGNLSYYENGKLVDVSLNFQFPQLIHMSAPVT